MSMINELQVKIACRDEVGVNSLDQRIYGKLPPDLFPVLYQSNALVGEAGEYANIVKKMVRDELLTPEEKQANDDKAREAGYSNMKEKRIVDAGKELADIVQYCALSAQALGIDLEQSIIQKFNEVSKKMGERANHITL